MEECGAPLHSQSPVSEATAPTGGPTGRAVTAGQVEEADKQFAASQFVDGWLVWLGVCQGHGLSHSGSVGLMVVAVATVYRYGPTKKPQEEDSLSRLSGGLGYQDWYQAGLVSNPGNPMLL